MTTAERGCACATAERVAKGLLGFEPGFSGFSPSLSKSIPQNSTPPPHVHLYSLADFCTQ